MPFKRLQLGRHGGLEGGSCRPPIEIGSKIGMFFNQLHFGHGTQHIDHQQISNGKSVFKPFPFPERVGKLAQPHPGKGTYRIHSCLLPIRAVRHEADHEEHVQERFYTVEGCEHPADRPGTTGFVAWQKPLVLLPDMQQDCTGFEQRQPGFPINRHLSEWLFGHGEGSDWIVSEVWWWSAKDSHNDFIRLLNQQGLVGLGAVLAVLAVWARSFPPGVAAPLLAALVASTAFSNGIMFRPQAGLIMPLALVAAAAAWQRRQAEAEA